jgi:two-component system sensor histidine kinase/response regulator
MLGTSEILSENPEQFNPETIKKFAVIMHNAARSGYALLENLLEWSRTQTGSIQFKPKKTGICDVIDQNIANLKVIADNKGITLYSDLKSDIELTADENMLNAIMRNLLTNAIKFTYSGGKVEVRAVPGKNDVVIQVSDNGVGIPNDKIDSIFQLHTKNTSIGTADERGTGLGLLICKEFVSRHGGNIWVSSDEGKGSTFSFSIPL